MTHDWTTVRPTGLLTIKTVVRPVGGWDNVILNDVLHGLSFHECGADKVRESQICREFDNLTGGEKPRHESHFLGSSHYLS
jgi:hypothetical protein